MVVEDFDAVVAVATVSGARGPRSVADGALKHSHAFTALQQRRSHVPPGKNSRLWRRGIQVLNSATIAFTFHIHTYIHTYIDI